MAKIKNKIPILQHDTSNHTGTIEKTAHKYLVKKDQQIGATIVWK